jgi:hypothetical protein
MWELRSSTPIIVMAAFAVEGMRGGTLGANTVKIHQLSVSGTQVSRRGH